MPRRCRGHDAYNDHDSLRASIIGRIANCRRCGGVLVSPLDVGQGDPGLNNAIHRIPHYPVDSVVWFVNTDLSSG